MNEIIHIMKRNISFAVVVGVLVIALALVATPVLAYSQTTPGGSYVNVAGGQSLKYRSYASTFPSFAANSLAKPGFQGMISPGRPSAALIIYARSHPVPVVAGGDISYSQPGPANSWADLFTSPSPSGCCGCG
jgi:hypothetical protein